MMIAHHSDNNDNGDRQQSWSSPHSSRIYSSGQQLPSYPPSPHNHRPELLSLPSSLPPSILFPMFPSSSGGNDTGENVTSSLPSFRLTYRRQPRIRRSQLQDNAGLEDMTTTFMPVLDEELSSGAMKKKCRLDQQHRQNEKNEDQCRMAAAAAAATTTTSSNPAVPEKAAAKPSKRRRPSYTRRPSFTRGSSMNRLASMAA